MRELAATLLISMACQTPAAVPSPPATPRPASPSLAAAASPSGAPPAPSGSTPIASATPAPATAAPAGARIAFTDLRLPEGDLADTALKDGRIVLAGTAPAGTWTSQWQVPGFAFDRLVPSWNADAPEGTFIRIFAQTRRAAGGESKWWAFGTWAYGDAAVKRASVKGQRDADGDVETDVLVTSAPMTAYRMRVTLAQAPGSSASPAVGLVAAVASDRSSMAAPPPGPVGAGAVRELSVPPYSQEIHAGEYPEYDGGGEAWCSPTSTAMVMAFWGKGPSSAELEWVDARYPDPQVDHAARYTFDAAYGGTGNWPFNTAYAARYGLRAFVTQLRSLAEAERFIAAGIPLVASLRVAPGALPGFLLPGGSPGHLLVISGFTASGDVVSHDPAAMNNAEVRRVYPRAAFERAWLGGSQGTVYVIRPSTTPLPERVPGATPNW